MNNRSKGTSTCALANARSSLGLKPVILIITKHFLDISQILFRSSTDPPQIFHRSSSDLSYILLRSRSSTDPPQIFHRSSSDLPQILLRSSTGWLSETTIFSIDSPPFQGLPFSSCYLFCYLSHLHNGSFLNF